jgi:SAM-dependent methyltransferase
VLTVASRVERATSFGAVAEDYNRLRPSPPDEAVDWLLPAHCEVAVDLAAGTGLLTRVLARKVRRVVAIELDERMAVVLRAQSPGVEVLQGRGEALPLADASADAVLISSAWHWLDPERAVPELGRVLRDGGRLGVLWPGANPEVSWMRELRRWRTSPAGTSELKAAGEAAAGESRDVADGAESRSWQRRTIALPEAGLFEAATTAVFEFTRTMTVDDFVDMMATYSAVITATEEERTAELARVRAGLERLFPGASAIDVPMRARCWRADRVPRNGVHAAT